MSAPFDAVVSLALTQRGLVTRPQLRSLGVSDATISRWLAAGLLRRVEELGVFVVGGAPITWHARLMARCLAHDGRASHISGAALYGCPGVVRSRPEIVVPYRAHAKAHLGVHRSRHFEEMPWRRIGGIPVVDPGPLALQLAGLVPERLPRDRFDDAVEHLVRSNVVSWEALVPWVDAGRRGRSRGVRYLGVIIDEYLGDHCESRLERQFRDLLVCHGVPLPVEQVEVVLPDGRKLRLDHAYPDIRYAIELDSKRYHLTDAAFENDREKRNALRSNGWFVHEFTKRMLQRRPESVVAEVTHMLDQRRRLRA